MFTVFGKRFNKHEPFVNTTGKTVDGVKPGATFDDGTPKQISLGTWTSEDTADLFADNVKANTAKRTWEIWIEEIK